jgi:hypothetical protein
MTSRRRFPMRAKAPSSSRSISAEKPATSAAKMAARRRVVILRKPLCSAFKAPRLVIRPLDYSTAVSAKVRLESHRRSSRILRRRSLSASCCRNCLQRRSLGWTCRNLDGRGIATAVKSARDDGSIERLEYSAGLSIVEAPALFDYGYCA